MEWMVGKFWNRPEIENELQMIRSFAVNPGNALRKIEKGHASSVVRAKALKLYFNLISSPFTYFGEFPVNSLHHLQINKRLTEKSKVYKELLEKYREEKLDYGTVASNLEYYRQEMELLQFGKPFPETLLHKGEQPDVPAKESVFEEGKVKLRSDAAVLLHFVSPNQIDPLSEVRRLKEKYQKELQVVCVFDGNRKLCHSVLKQHKLPWTFYYENYTDVWPGLREPPSIKLFLNDFPVYKLRKFQSVLLSPGRKLFAIGEMTDEMDSLVQQALKSVR